MAKIKSRRKADSNHEPRGLVEHPNELLQQLRGHRKPIADDYVYVPKGNVYITRHCRDMTQQSGFDLYVVYHQGNHSRLGLDCPQWIFEAVNADAVASIAQRQQVVAAKDQRDRHEAKAVLEQVFPFMPSSSLTAILDHGFEKRSGRVGRVQKLDEVVKANLAVNAHIRHNMTAYDSLYSTMKAVDPSQDVKTQARIAVYDQVKQIADSWRTGIFRPPLAEVENSASPIGPAPDQTTTILKNVPDLRVMHGGVQKTRKEPENPTRVQPKRTPRGISALNKALASMGLEDHARKEGEKVKLPKAVRLQNRTNQSEADLRKWRAGITDLPANRLHHVIRLQAANLTKEEERRLRAARASMLSLRRQARDERRQARC